MLIVFEGADCLGKTTLAKRVAELLNIPIVKKDLSWVTKGDLHDDRIEDCARSAADVLMQLASHTDFIVDRMAISSLVYSEVYNREADTAWALNALQQKDVIFIVFASRDSAVWLEKIHERGEHLIDHIKLRRINGGFLIFGQCDSALIMEPFRDIHDMALEVIDFIRSKR